MGFGAVPLVQTAGRGDRTRPALGACVPAPRHHRTARLARRRSRRIGVPQCAGWAAQRRKQISTAGIRRVLMAGRTGPDDRAVGQLTIVPSFETGPERFQEMMKTAQRLEVGDKSLIRPSPVGSFGLKGFHREPTVFWCCGPGYGVCSGSVNRL